MFVEKLENDIILSEMKELEKQDTKYLNKMKEELYHEKRIREDANDELKKVASMRLTISAIDRIIIKRMACKHDWDEIDRIGCMYHVELGCEDVMQMCKICGESREYHSMKNAKMSLGEWSE